MFIALFSKAKRWKQPSVQQKTNWSYCNMDELDTCYNVDETWKHYATWYKLEINGQILYSSTYMRYLDQTNLLGH